MSVEVAEARLAPRHDLPWMRRESRPASVVAFALGTASIVVLLTGSVVVAVTHGLTPVSVVIDAITSPALATVNIAAIVLGGAAMLIGASTYRRMPTRLARNEAVAGAILGVQALLLGGSLLLVLHRERADVRHQLPQLRPGQAPGGRVRDGGEEHADPGIRG
jgi:hypothetical protein